MKKYTLLFLTSIISVIAFAGKPKKAELVNVDADHAAIQYIGRFDFTNPKAVRFAWPGVYISTGFEGKVCNIKLKETGGGTDGYGNAHQNYYNIIIDGKAPIVIKANPAKEIYKIDSLKEGAHTIAIYKRTEGLVGEGVFISAGERKEPLGPNKSIDVLSI